MMHSQMFSVIPEGLYTGIHVFNRLESGLRLRISAGMTACERIKDQNVYMNYPILQSQSKAFCKKLGELS